MPDVNIVPIKYAVSRSKEEAHVNDRWKRGSLSHGMSGVCGADLITDPVIELTATSEGLLSPLALCKSLVSFEEMKFWCSGNLVFSPRNP